MRVVLQNGYRHLHRPAVIRTLEIIRDARVKRREQINDQSTASSVAVRGQYDDGHMQLMNPGSLSAVIHLHHRGRRVHTNLFLYDEACTESPRAS